MRAHALIMHISGYFRRRASFFSRRVTCTKFLVGEVDAGRPGLSLRTVVPPRIAHITCTVCRASRASHPARLACTASRAPHRMRPACAASRLTTASLLRFGHDFWCLHSSRELFLYSTSRMVRHNVLHALRLLSRCQLSFTREPLYVAPMLPYFLNFSNYFSRIFLQPSLFHELFSRLCIVPFWFTLLKVFNHGHPNLSSHEIRMFLALLSLLPPSPHFFTLSLTMITDVRFCP